MKVTLQRPWLSADLEREARVISWAVNRPGIVTAKRIVWREVKNADLPDGFDVIEWFTGELAARGDSDAVAMLTSRDVTAFEERRVSVEGVTAHVLATVGLSNGERVGARVDYSGHDWGTINVAVELDCGLTDAALIEAMSIATQARTAAVMDTGFDLPTGTATGTGTDCVALAAPLGDTQYAGLHTAVGEAVGKGVYDAVRAGARVWMDKVRRR